MWKCSQVGYFLHGCLKFSLLQCAIFRRMVIVISFSVFISFLDVCMSVHFSALWACLQSLMYLKCNLMI